MPIISFEIVTLLLRISFLIGAITDGLSIIPMVFPSIGSKMFGSALSKASTAENRFGMNFGAALMAGWTLILIWGSFDPIGRRDILILVIPVIIGILASMMVAAKKQVISRNRAIPVWIHLSFCTILFVVSYALSFRITP